MKNYILLGMLLLTGLSFAVEIDGYNWMEYLQGRYACNAFYNWYGYQDSPAGIGLYEIAEDYGCGTYWPCTAMDTEFDYMYMLVADDMYCDSGCDCRPYIPDFRQEMLSYASHSASYKAYFLAGARAFLADPFVDADAKADFKADLQAALADYQYCINDVGACYSMPL